MTIEYTIESRGQTGLFVSADVLKCSITAKCGKKFHRIERSYGSFVRTFSLPDVIDEEKVKADFKDGVLNLHLPKSEAVLFYYR